MAAFIVISAENRLHYIVDGIEKCRPLNPGISAEISTGKIIKADDGGYLYEYTIHGESTKSEKEKSLSSILSNQLAAFRLAYTIPENQLVNIFFLENPLTEKELDESESWIDEFNKVYKAGTGNDTDFCVFRVVFTYDHNCPCDISSKVDRNVLKRLIDSHKKAVSCDTGEGMESAFDRYIFYIDNQKSDSAALCLRKDEHDFKIPRILIDFMMLVSDENDKYNILNAINPATVTTRCFSIGFAESMYYYPDVEKYFIKADSRDLNLAMLSNPDDNYNDISMKIMDVEKYPFGLRERKNRLKVLYQDIPLSEDITLNKNTADYKIDKSISQLKVLLQNERQQEYEDFENSDNVVCLKNNIKELNAKISEAKQADNESIEDYNNRFKQLNNEKKEKEDEYDKIRSEFEPICPEYTDRDELYLDLNVIDNDDFGSISTKEKQYNDLVEFARSKQFRDFVEKNILSKANLEETDQLHNNVVVEDSELKPGCLSFLFFWKQHKNISMHDIPADHAIQIQKEPNPKDLIKVINDNLNLKKAFRQFVKDVDIIEYEYSIEKKECDEFKLTDHENHYFPIIDLDKLRKEQEISSPMRRARIIQEWKQQSNPTKTSLFDLIRKESSAYTSKTFSYIKWEKRYSFVQDITSSETLADICNQLQRRAAPLVNYNLTKAINGDNITRLFFSDIPEFNDKIQQIRSKLQNGQSITGVESSHTASKICMLQFLPMDDDILSNLVDLQDI